jgi:hypothetical protein
VKYIGFVGSAGILMQPPLLASDYLCADCGAHRASSWLSTLTGLLPLCDDCYGRPNAPDIGADVPAKEEP